MDESILALIYLGKYFSYYRRFLQYALVAQLDSALDSDNCDAVAWFADFCRCVV